MYPFDKIDITGNNITEWVNARKYIVRHHTASENTEGDLAVLSWRTDRKVSVHFLIWKWGVSYKLADPKSICWHCWESRRWDDIYLNYFALGIEITGIDKFDTDQFLEAVKLTRHLQKTYKIPKENVLTHASITRDGAINKILWDGISSTRKPDPNRSLRSDRWYDSFEIMRDNLLT